MDTAHSQVNENPIGNIIARGLNSRIAKHAVCPAVRCRVHRGRPGARRDMLVITVIFRVFHEEAAYWNELRIG